MIAEYKHFIFSTGIAISVLLETVAYTYMQQNGSTFYYSSSVIYFLAGLLICLLPVLYTPTCKNKAETTPGYYRYIGFVVLLFLLSLLVYHISLLAPLYKKWHISIPIADMIPTIQLACKRFLHGQTVYGPAPEIEPWAIIPYLPMVWMPFLPSVAFGFDPRWTTVSAVFIGIFLMASPLIKGRRPVPLLPMLVICTSLFLLLNYFLMKYIGFWAMTQEGVVAGLYMILCYALLRRNFYFTGIAITLCLLSRYALVLWIPSFLFYTFLTEPRKYFWQLFIAFSASMLILFILPFFIKDPMYFFGLPANQAQAFRYFWEGNHIEAKQFFNVGFYKIFSIDQIWLMTTLEIVTSFAVPALFLAVIFLIKSRFLLNPRFIAFASLKLCLIFFYGFLAAPYAYIFFPAALVSYVMAFDFINQNSLLKAASNKC